MIISHFISKFTSLYKTKLVWFIEHTLFILIPLFFITQYPKNYVLGYSIAALSTVYMVGISMIAGARLKIIGITTRYFIKALSFISLPTLVVASIIIAGRFVFPQAFVIRHLSLQSKIVYILISVPLQEILFRGFCLWRCKLSFQNPLFIVVFNSILFAIYHIMFRNWWFVGGVFLVNLFWSYAFIKFPNLYAFILSHAILGTLYFISV